MQYPCVKFITVSLYKKIVQSTTLLVQHYSTHNGIENIEVNRFSRKHFKIKKNTITSLMILIRVPCVTIVAVCLKYINKALHG